MKVIEGTNVAVSDFTPDTKSRMWIEALEHSPIGYGRALDAMGYTRRTTHKDRRRIPDLACIRCGAIEPPTADREAYPVTLTAGTYPANPVRFYCEPGNHSFNLADLIEHWAATKAGEK
jgi:hypothetical protein